MTAQKLWLVEFSLDADVKDIFMEELDEFADSMACFEDGSDLVWKLQLYTQTEPDASLQNAINELAKQHKVKDLSVEVNEVEAQDWVSESQKNFEAVRAGRFFIYPSWRRDEVPENAIPIEIDPKRAFGTGGHETTRGCMLAMQTLLRHNFKSMIDMGCGSGLLGIAMAKLWPKAKIVAVDNDPVCVETTIENAEINHVLDNLEIDLSDGYNSDTVQGNAPYQLIVANIMAQPLIEFAPQAREVLAPKGYLILAGLLTKQARAVILAHEQNGFKLLEREDYAEWSVLVMQGV